MAIVESTMLELGENAPEFKLPDPDGKLISNADVMGDNGLVVMFISNHCPFVIHVAQEITRVADTYLDKGVGFIAIGCNDLTTHPQDGPKHIRDFAAKYQFPFPYVFDATQQTAKQYKAACTPDFYVADTKGRIFYRGRLDNSTPSNNLPLTGQDLRDALDALVNGDTPPINQFPSMGCNIKWKKGNEPEYFGVKV